MKKDLIRQQIRFFGSVQGVGFRYTANSIAQSLGITGWVLNDYDGTVLMEAQGTKSEIENLISRLNDGTFISIDRVEKNDLPVDTSEKYFRIKGW
ncbi:MAG: acylphosphatase [Treponema sp.]|uniref:acylphosphatase n=1 Tax=Treponema sp. TaxID=166 RepID=UPI00298E95C3|nr:acylphosphatase [Treponema sp.]MCR5385691.1 acylphosphatase [Treponema sp.]